MFKNILIIISILLFTSASHGFGSKKDSGSLILADGMDVVLEGKVLRNTPTTLTLKSLRMKKNVLIEMNSKATLAKNKTLKEGDEIVVSGKVDNDPKKGLMIEAESIATR